MIYKTPKKSTKKSLELINKFSKVEEHRINRKKSAVFLYSNSVQSKQEIKLHQPTCFLVCFKELGFINNTTLSTCVGGDDDGGKCGVKLRLSYKPVFKEVSPSPSGMEHQVV